MSFASVARVVKAKEDALNAMIEATIWFDRCGDAMTGLDISGAQREALLKKYDAIAPLVMAHIDLVARAEREASEVAWGLVHAVATAARKAAEGVIRSCDEVRLKVRTVDP